MQSFHDDDLILFRYGESRDAEAIRAALADDPELARRYAELERLLDATEQWTEPAPPPGLEERIWHRVRARLETAPAPAGGYRRVAAPWRLAALGALASLVLAGAFVLGRWSGPEVAPEEIAWRQPAAAGFGAEARERMLMASLAGHLDASERLLTELVNRGDAESLEAERELAAALVASHRLYRRAAERTGQRRIVALLDQLEPVLLELANAPDGAVGAEDLRRLVESEDLLFRVRIVGGRIDSRAPRPMPIPPITQL